MHGPCGLDMEILKQNGSDACEHEACTHAAGAFKERSWWERAEQKRPVLENVPPWRCRQGNGLHGTGEQKPQEARFPPRGQAKKAPAGPLGVIPHARAPMPSTTTCLADP